MPKRRTDASKRTFFDQYERIKASYFRARDVIDPAKNRRSSRALTARPSFSPSPIADFPQAAAIRHSESGGCR
jgi:hypothetical protein